MGHRCDKINLRDTNFEKGLYYGQAKKKGGQKA